VNDNFCITIFIFTEKTIKTMTMMTLFGLCKQAKPACFPNVGQDISAAQNLIHNGVINVHLHILPSHQTGFGVGYYTWPYCDFDDILIKHSARV